MHSTNPEPESPEPPAVAAAGTIRWNLVWTYGARVASPLLGYVSFLIIARRLGQDGVGQYAFLTTLSTLGACLSHPGVDSYLLREAAQRPEEADALAADALGVKALLGVVGLAAAFAGVVALGRAQDDLVALAVMCLYQIVVAIDVVPAQLLKARERFNVVALGQLAERFTNCVCVAVFVTMSGGMRRVGGAVLIAALVRHLIHLSRVWPPEYLRRRPSGTGMRRLALDSISLGAVELLLFVYFRIDSLMLSVLAGDAATGLYAAAYRLLDGALILPLGLLAVCYPRLAKSAVDGREAFLAEVRRWLEILVQLSAPAACGLYLVAPAAARMLYGAEFSGVTPIVQILSGAYLLLFVTYYLGYLLTALDRQREYAMIMGGAAALNIALNLALIPRFAGVGAAWATLMAEVFALVVLSWVVRDTLTAVWSWRWVRDALAGTLIMALAVSTTLDRGLVIQVVVGALTYGLFWVAKERRASR